MSSLYTRKFQSAFISLFSQPDSAPNPNSEAFELHRMDVLKSLSKKNAENFDYHPAILPASRKLSKTGRHYAATTHIFRNIIDNLEPHLKWQFNAQFHRKPD